MVGLISAGFATKLDAVTITSSTGPLGLVLMIISMFGRQGQSEVLRKLESWFQLLFFEAPAALFLVPVSAGMFPVLT